MARRGLRRVLSGSFIGLAAGALAGCNAVSMTTAPSVNGDIPIATLSDAPPGSNEDFVINVGRRVYFAENSAELNGTAKATLDKQASWLNSYGSFKVKIEGFADEKGSAAFNKDLGLRRAQAIATYLESKGVSVARIRTKSFGNERLVKKCDDISCWSQNRRGITVLDTEVDS
jgi:peptidoglycan-associated lipoprotein